SYCCLFCSMFFICVRRHVPRSTLVPYTTLFRSVLLLVGWEAVEAAHRLDRLHGQRLGELVSAVRHERDPVLFSSTGDALSVQPRSEEHTSELQSRRELVCRLLLEKKKAKSLGN